MFVVICRAIAAERAWSMRVTTGNGTHRRLLGMVLGCTLAVGACPTAVIAGEVVPVEDEGIEGLALVAQGEEVVQPLGDGDALTVQGTDDSQLNEQTVLDGVEYIDENGRLRIADEVKSLPSTGTEWPSGSYLVDSNMEIDERITVTGHVHLILADAVTLTCKQGITVTGMGHELRISGQSDGSGTLIATGCEGAAGIGGDSTQSGGTVLIHGGNVKATGGEGAAGIGGGRDQHGGIVFIYGGTVTATGGGSGAPGIGGGQGKSGGMVRIADGLSVLAGRSAGDARLVERTTYTQEGACNNYPYARIFSAVQSVSVDPGAATLTVGETVALTSTVLPEGASNRAVAWTSGDESVATVDDKGTVTAVAAGTATITATAKDGSGKSASCAVTVRVPAMSAPVATAHVQRIGWMSAVADGGVVGTTGKSLRLESLSLKLPKGVPGGVEYRSHVQRAGWEKTWAANGKTSGTVGKSRRLEAVQIRLTGAAKDLYDVYYRVHVQRLGWTAWAKNGGSAGTQGMSRRAEAIQVVLVRKGEPALGVTHKGVTQQYAKAFVKKR